MLPAASCFYLLSTGDSAQNPSPKVCLTVATPSDSTVCKVKSESADKCETRERVGIRLSIALAKS